MGLAIRAFRDTQTAQLASRQEPASERQMRAVATDANTAANQVREFERQIAGRVAATPPEAQAIYKLRIRRMRSTLDTEAPCPQ